MNGASVATLGVVTVCMNRQHHLAVSAAQLASWPHHQEHLIIDWSSDHPIDRDQLPPDPRIRLLRVSGESRWNLCRAYNFAVQNSHAELLLKLDADCWPGEINPFELMNGRPNVCWFGSGSDGRLGQFLMSRQAFLDVGGFNEVLEGYGFDDKELKARLQAYGWSLRNLEPSALHVISHSIHERVSRSQEAGFKPSALEESISFAQRRATSMSNRVAAAYFPWTAHRARSSYQQDASGAWHCVLDSVPVLEPSIAHELVRLRRQIFWSRFLELPELHVKLLPVKLLPPDRRGVFKVRVWHRVYWHTVRRIFRLPCRWPGASERMPQFFSVTTRSRLVGLRTKLWRRWLWFRFRHEIADSVFRSQQAIQGGDVEGSVDELCRQVVSFQWPFQLDQQLFCRDQRPKDPEQSLALLLQLHHCSYLLSYQHFYAGVAAVYTALAHNLVSDLGSTQVWLQDQARLRGVDDQDLVARSRNRENLYKQIVSARACLLQLSLLQGASENQLISMIGKSNLALIRVLDFQKISPDALYRSTTNLVRGLLPLSFESESLAALLPKLWRLRDEFSCRRYQRVRRLAKEDHLQRLNDVIDLLQHAQLHDDPELRDRRLLLMLNQPTSMLTAAARQWLHSLPDFR